MDTSLATSLAVGTYVAATDGVPHAVAERINEVPHGAGLNARTGCLLARRLNANIGVDLRGVDLTWSRFSVSPPPAC
jgi:hypothetical protein